MSKVTRIKVDFGFDVTNDKHVSNVVVDRESAFEYESFSINGLNVWKQAQKMIGKNPDHMSMQRPTPVVAVASVNKQHDVVNQSGMLKSLMELCGVKN